MLSSSRISPSPILNHCIPPINDDGEVVPVSSTLLSDFTKLVPYATTTKLVYKYEHELNGLLKELDGINRGDAEVRGKRKEVIKAVEGFGGSRACCW